MTFFIKGLQIFTEDMAEGFAAGAGIAWRLLATLEGGTLLLATSALIAYTTRRKLMRRKRNYRPIKNVLITNTTSILGRELKQKLEDRGCSVRTSREDKMRGEDKIDCLIIIGADYKDGLDGVAQLVTEDVYNNLHLLEELSLHLHRGGSVMWVSGAGPRQSGAYCGATAAFRALTRAALLHVAKLCHCEPLWVEGCDVASTAKTVENILAELFPSSTHDGFPFRNATHRISKYLYGWMNVII